MRQFVEAINRAGHHRAVYFNIPLSWAIAGLSCASKFGSGSPSIWTTCAP